MPQAIIYTMPMFLKWRKDWVWGLFPLATLDGFSCPGGGGVTLQPLATSTIWEAISEELITPPTLKCLDSNLWALHPLPHCCGVPVYERYTFIQWHRLNTYVHTYIRIRTKALMYYALLHTHAVRCTHVAPCSLSSACPVLHGERHAEHACTHVLLVAFPLRQ